jgi:hypothetical protein
MAKADAMSPALGNIGKAIRARRAGWLAISVGAVAVYYLGLLASLVLQFGNLPNYVTAYDWTGNVARIFTSTPSFSDAVQIAREEWLLEIGYLNTDFGLGISEWSLTLVPEKMLLILAMSMMLASIWALNAVRGERCGLGEGGATVGATGLGAGLVALTGATMTWVVCCATPSWIVGLTMLGLGVATANWLEPVGVWLNIAGFAVLAFNMLVLAHRLGDAATEKRANVSPQQFVHARMQRNAR